MFLYFIIEAANQDFEIIIYQTEPWVISFAWQQITDNSYWNSFFCVYSTFDDFILIINMNHQLLWEYYILWMYISKGFFEISMLLLIVCKNNYYLRP